MRYPAPLQPYKDISMKHDVTVVGPAFRLRPITLEDSAFIVSLRCDPERSRFLGKTSPDIRAQEHWLENYSQREGDYYFIVENLSGLPEGALALYDVAVTDKGKSGEWGRWILKRGSMAAVESALLLYHAAFEHIRLDWIYCRTVRENAHVASFHASCGLKSYPAPLDSLSEELKKAEVSEHKLTKEEWPTTRNLMTPLAQRLAKKLGTFGED